MKRWKITGLPASFFPDLRRIAELFFDRVEIKGEGSSCEEHIHFTIADEVHMEWKKGKVVEQYTEPLVLKYDQPKLAVKRIFLRALEKMTGITHPWGILTGVRPIKLWHLLKQEGKSYSEILKILSDIYLVQPEKIQLMDEIVTRQLTVLPDLYQLQGEVSLYIGIPFCPTKCAYCTFPAYALTGRTGSVEDFLTGLHAEIAAIGHWLKEQRLSVTTVYFGGGTPTSLTTEQLEGLFHALKKHLPHFEQIREITVEAGRPDTLDEEKLRLIKDWQIDRISINPQTFKEETLQKIGRHHTVREVVKKYELARQIGIENINMDLIIGLPGEDMATLKASLAMVAELKPDSVTVHTLSYKRGSAITQKKEQYQVTSPDEVVDMVQVARQWAKQHQYVPYYLYRQKNILGNQENVGYALKGKESLYNIIIMEEKQSIIGLGCGAVSKLISPYTGKYERFPNPKEPKHYIETFPNVILRKLSLLHQFYDPKGAEGQAALIRGY